jgi:hypothetical protein
MSKRKRDNHSLLLREMAAMGVPLDRSVDGIDVEIEQVGGVTDSIVFDLDDGRCGWMIDLLITNQTSRSIWVRDVALRPRWPNPDFERLPDPKEVGGEPYYYRFPGKGAFEMPRELVINHVLLHRGILKPGRPVEGWLLGIGNPKPATLPLGAHIEVELAIIAYDHSEYKEKIALWVEPVMTRQQKSSRRISTEGLYASERAQNLGSPNFGNIGQSPGRESAPLKKSTRAPKSAKVVRSKVDGRC